MSTLLKPAAWPWQVRKEDTKNGVSCAIVSPKFGVIALVKHGGGKKEENANLLAAAPELLAALESAVAAWDSDSAPNSWAFHEVVIARAIIAKARGAK